MAFVLNQVTLAFYLLILDVFVIFSVFVLNKATAADFRPERVQCMQKTVRQLMHQSKLKYTGYNNSLHFYIKHGRVVDCTLIFTCEGLSAAAYFNCVLL